MVIKELERGSGTTLPEHFVRKFRHCSECPGKAQEGTDRFMTFIGMSETQTTVVGAWRF